MLFFKKITQDLRFAVGLLKGGRVVRSWAGPLTGSAEALAVHLGRVSSSKLGISWGGAGFTKVAADS
jgi:hypothetical protein